MSYRFGRERAGLRLRDVCQRGAAGGYMKAGSGKADVCLDAEPFRLWLDAVYEKEGVVEGSVGVHREAWNVTDLARNLHLDERTLWRIRRGGAQTLTLATADSAMEAYGKPIDVPGVGLDRLFLWDLWPRLAA
jgi:hypothetical protein